MLKNSVLTLLLAHGMAAMAQTVSGNVFCAGTTYDPAPASVSISGTVAAGIDGITGCGWFEIHFMHFLFYAGFLRGLFCMKLLMNLGCVI